MIKLSNAEWKIMNLLWEQVPRTMIQITKALWEETGWTKHTVITYLKRMEEKGAVRHEEGGRAKLYFAAMRQDDAMAQETDSLLDRVFQGNAGLMISTMIEQSPLTETELQELYAVLEKKQK